jgi:hypothetical protein
MLTAGEEGSRDGDADEEDAFSSSVECDAKPDTGRWCARGRMYPPPRTLISVLGQVVRLVVPAVQSAAVVVSGSDADSAVY